MGIAIRKLFCVQFRTQQMSKYSDAFGGPDFPHREMETQHMQWGEVRENLCYLLKTRNISMESLRLKIKYMHTHTYIYVSVQFSC